MGALAENRAVADFDPEGFEYLVMPGLPGEKVWWRKVSYDEETGQGSYLMIMAPGDRTWDHEATASKPGAEQAAKAAGKPAGSRRLGAMAAVIALATVAGAIGGALATAGLGHLAAPAAAAAKDTAAKDAAAKEAADASLARMESEIAALKASVERTVSARR